MTAPVDVLAEPTLLREARAMVDRADRIIEEAKQAAAAAKSALDGYAAVVEAASRHIHAVDYPCMDGADAGRQARTLRSLSAALARAGGGA